MRSTSASHHSSPLPPGPELAVHDPAGRRQPGQRAVDDGDAEAEPAGDVGGVERAVRAGVARDEVAERVARPAR